MQHSQIEGKRTTTPHFLLVMVVAGIIVSILLEVTAQLLPPYYNPISQPESDLAVGPYGFLMALNFVVRGIVYLFFLVAFMKAVPKEDQSRSGLILLGISAIGKFIIAFAATDLTPRPETIHGIIHTIAALLSFLTGTLGVLLLARALHHVSNMRPSPRFLVGLAWLTFIWSLIVIVTVAMSSQIHVWGLLERILTGLFFLWILLASLSLWRFPSEERIFS